MTSQRVLKTQAEVLARYRRIGDLWAAYYARSTVGPEVFGREFYHAVGELLQGTPLEKLELVHLDVQELESIVFPGKMDDQQTSKQRYRRPRIQKRR
jgi:hypothetical protein